jgi:hypothetical protein
MEKRNSTDWLWDPAQEVVILAQNVVDKPFIVIRKVFSNIKYSLENKT